MRVVRVYFVAASVQELDTTTGTILLRSINPAPKSPKTSSELFCFWLFHLFSICPHLSCRNMVRRVLEKDVKKKLTGIKKDLA